MKHPHYELMQKFLEDAKNSDKPWEVWEFRNSSGKWVQMKECPTWHPEIKYRRTIPFISITLNTVRPASRIFKEGETYWFASYNSQNRRWCANKEIWENLPKDNYRQRAGLVHETEEEAEYHADTIAKITAGLL